MGDWGPEGRGEPSAKLTASGGYGPIPSPLWQDAMPRRRESQYGIGSPEKIGEAEEAKLPGAGIIPEPRPMERITDKANRSLRQL